jgi:lysozyme family protein
MIQRTLGVKVDGIMGTKSMAALEAMKQTQISLGFTTKTLTELEESKPLLQLMQGIKKCLLRLWHKKSQLLLIDLWTL